MPDDLPNLPILQPLKAGKKPFLGKRDANILRAVANAINNARCVPVSPASASAIIGTGGNIGPTGDSSTAAAQNPFYFTISNKGLVLNYAASLGQSQSGGNSSYRGEYDPSGATTFGSGPFNFGDTVRVSPGNTVSTVSGGSVIPGVYVCVQAGPGEDDLPNHPLSPGGETAFWQWLSTWPSTVNQCNSDGSTSTYFADQQKEPT